MKLSSVEELVELLKRNGEDLKPMTEDQVKKVESLSNKPLPQVYKEFLLQMGKGAGRFMEGSSAFYNEIFELQDWANELLNDNGIEPLPKNSFVFWMHQGYQMSYFILGESENPKVYYYSEGKGLNEFIKKDSLLEFFEKQLVLSGLDM